MAQTITSGFISDRTEAEMLTTIDKLGTEIDRLLGQMKQERQESDFLRAESRLTLDRIEATLDRIKAGR